MLALASLGAADCRGIIFNAVEMVKEGKYAPQPSEITKACTDDNWLGMLYEQDRNAYMVSVLVAFAARL